MQTRGEKEMLSAVMTVLLTETVNQVVMNLRVQQR